MSRPTISLCMYLRDEEAGLEAAIKSVLEYIDDVVIWDTGSVDGTLEIARRYADRIYTLPVPDDAIDFGEMESMVCHLAKYDWVFRLDGDETVENAHLLEELTDSEDYGAWKFARFRWADLAQTVQLDMQAFPDWQPRLFLNDKQSWYRDALHPRFETPHQIGEAANVFLHHHVDTLHLSDPRRVERRNRLYERLAQKAGKQPEGSLEAMRLAQR